MQRKMWWDYLDSCVCAQKLHIREQVEVAPAIWNSLDVQTAQCGGLSGWQAPWSCTHLSAELEGDTSIENHSCALWRGRWPWSSLRCLSESLNSEKSYSQWPWPGRGKTGDPVSPSRRPMACLALSWAKAHCSYYIFLSGFSIDGLISNSFYGNLPV